jgi:hypothetical protein
MMPILIFEFNWTPFNRKPFIGMAFDRFMGLLANHQQVCLPTMGFCRSLGTVFPQPQNDVKTGCFIGQTKDLRQDSNQGYGVAMPGQLL